MEAYLARKGMPIVRRIDVMAPRPAMGSLHGVEPKGRPHFDWNWFFNPEVALAPTQGGTLGESGCNLCGWNRSYMNEYYSDFPFRKVGAAEEQALSAFFKSDYWHQGLAATTQSTTNHGHINCWSSVHPDIVQRFAEASLREKGWEIYYTCPNVYWGDGKYNGKLVFMGKNPEAVYDIGWKFSPDVVIAPVDEHWCFPDQVNYDLWTQAMLDKVLAQPYVALAKEDIARVISAIAPAK